MANPIRIKRRDSGGSAGAPATLKNAELAFNEADDTLYYGKGDNAGDATSIISIGGPGSFLRLAGAQTVTGDKTFSGANDFTGGSLQAPTRSAADNTTHVATTAWVQGELSSFGSVTSVGLALPTALFDVTNSPVTDSGTLTATLDNQAQNAVFAGPSTGGAGTPGFRSLIEADIPSLAHTKISDFDAGVQTNRLDQMAAPTSDVSFNNVKITGLATPINDQDAANKAYVDANATGFDIHDPVQAATTTNITLSGSQTIDGVTLSNGERVLVKDQTDLTENGVYTYNSAGAWSRAADADTNGEIESGFYVFVEAGTVNNASSWVVQTADTAIDIGTDDIPFVQFSAAADYGAGTGLTKSGSTFNVETADSARIVVNADNIDLATVSQTDTSGSAGINFVQSITKDSYGRISGRVLADVRTGSTAQTGILQLTDSVVSTSTTTAATPNSVKTAYDLANAALPLGGGTLTGKLTLVNAATGTASLNLGTGVADPSAPADGDFWSNSDVLKYYTGSVTKTIAFTDSNITGNAANVTGTVAVTNGGTNITSYTTGDLLYASGATTLSKLAGVATGNALISGGVGTAPTWGKIGLTTHVSGVLPSANGGTGANLSGASDGTIFKSVSGAFTAATAGTDYLNNTSTIDGGSF